MTQGLHQIDHHPLRHARRTVMLVGVLIILKLCGFVVSHSTSILSSLMDSLADAGLSIMTLIAVMWSLKPADARHRHGHGKIEAISALLQAAFLVGAGSFLMLEAFNRFFNPVELQNHIPAILLMILSTVIAFVLSYLQKHGAHESRSLALEADHAHYASDVWLNGSVLIVLILSFFEIGPVWIDPLCAIFVAGLFMTSSFTIAKKAFDMLMDREEEGAVRDQVIAIINAHPHHKGFHDFRMTRSGMRYFISFDLAVDGDKTLTQAHDVARDIEHTIHNTLPRAEILIHLDPADDTADLRHHRSFS